jgi:hypothetical protein
VRRVVGQAGRGLKLLARVCLTLSLLVGLALGGIVWRLEQGPLSLPWLARLAESLANQSLADQNIVIGGAEISWAGWRDGHRSPIAVRFSDIRLSDTEDGLIAVLPRVDASLSAGSLLRGHIALRGWNCAGLVCSRSGTGRARSRLGWPARQRLKARRGQGRA